MVVGSSTLSEEYTCHDVADLRSLLMLLLAFGAAAVAGFGGNIRSFGGKNSWRKIQNPKSIQLITYPKQRPSQNRHDVDDTTGQTKIIITLSLIKQPIN